MSKISFLSILMVSTALFISCSPIVNEHKVAVPQEPMASSLNSNSYGAYLSGMVAQIRKDYDDAADYYKIASEQDPENIDLVSRLYILLASKGRIEEASVYADKAISLNTDDNFAYIIVASQKLHNGDYQASISATERIKDPTYSSLMVPVINAWNYAGLKEENKAFTELKKLKKDKNLIHLYNQQRAMLLDYFNHTAEAEKAYEKMLADKNGEISVRMLELITNFYIRNGQKDKAVVMMNTMVNGQYLDNLLSSLRNKVNQAQTDNTQAILNNAQIGAAEALFAIASSFYQDEMLDVAHLYTSLTIYMNPDYHTAKILMADIFESRGMYEDANRIYDSIKSGDIAYYPAQLKKARNLIKQDDYKGAEILLESLNEDYDDINIYMELGDVLRLNGRYTEAISYYDKAIAMADNNVTLWVLYYAKGISLERMGQMEEAEEYLLKAYNINRHFLVLNHIGYSWIKQGKKVNEAFEMIVSAYNQAPFDPNINDSLGFALYNLGYYNMSLKYLEKAADIYPSSAVINSHLGDAYWLAGRKNEARFQWQHSLQLKDDTGELNPKATKQKLNKGLKDVPELSYDKEMIEQTIQKIRKTGKSSSVKL